MKLINTARGIDQNTYAPYVDVTIRLGESEAEWYAGAHSDDDVSSSVTTLGTELLQHLQKSIKEKHMERDIITNIGINYGPKNEAFVVVDGENISLSEYLDLRIKAALAQYAQNQAGAGVLPAGQ